MAFFQEVVRYDSNYYRGFKMVIFVSAAKPNNFYALIDFYTQSTSPT
jgi:hypothetical protein